MVSSERPLVPHVLAGWQELRQILIVMLDVCGDSSVLVLATSLREADGGGRGDGGGEGEYDGLVGCGPTTGSL